MRTQMPLLLAACLLIGCAVPWTADQGYEPTPDGSGFDTYYGVGGESDADRAYLQAGLGLGEQEIARGGLAAPAEPMTADTEPVPTMSAVDPRKVIYTGNLQIATADPEAAVQRTRELAESVGGYMQQMTGSGIVVRVPAEKFDETVAAVEQFGVLVDKDISAQDVTEQYEDLTIRLTNARALMTKLQNLLDRAQTVEDALKVEKELTRVRTQVEQLEGRLNRLSSQLAYATLAVEFIPTHATPPGLQARLPFWWLGRLGLDTLMDF